MDLIVDPYEPVILAVSPKPLPKIEVMAPSSAKRGSMVEIGISAGSTPAENHIFHVDVLNPQGSRVLYYSGNLFAAGGHARKLLPLAADEAVGDWKIRIRDAFTGDTTELVLAVN